MQLERRYQAFEDRFDKSPRLSADEADGKHFLNVPNLQTMSMSVNKTVSQNNNQNVDLFESKSIKDPMQTTEKNNNLFMSEEEMDKKNSSKKEMLSSKASRSCSQEFIEKEGKQNYRINQEKLGTDRRRSYGVDLLAPPVEVIDLRPRQRSCKQIRNNSSLKDNINTIQRVSDETISDREINKSN